MPAQMIELEEMTMEISDDILDSESVVGGIFWNTNKYYSCPVNN